MNLAGGIYVSISIISLSNLLFHIKNYAAVPKVDLNEGFGLDESIEPIVRDSYSYL
jgi:hypothetical protein